MDEQLTTVIYNVSDHKLTFSSQAKGAGAFLLKCHKAAYGPGQVIEAIFRRIRRKALRDLLLYALQHDFPVKVDSRLIRTEADIEAVLGPAEL